MDTDLHHWRVSWWEESGPRHSSTVLGTRDWSPRCWALLTPDLRLGEAEVRWWRPTLQLSPLWEVQSPYQPSTNIGWSQSSLLLLCYLVCHVSSYSWLWFSLRRRCFNEWDIVIEPDSLQSRLFTDQVMFLTLTRLLLVQEARLSSPAQLTLPQRRGQLLTTHGAHRRQWPEARL